MRWTDDMVKVLVSSWRAGETASQIATRIGHCSRSAVIGKLHRLGMAGRTAPQRRYASAGRVGKVNNARRKAAKRPSNAQVAARIAATITAERLIIQAGPDIEIPIDQRKTLMQLEPGDCRWPYGEGPYYFCCHKALMGKVYCEFHEKRGTTPIVWRRPDWMPAVHRFFPAQLVTDTGAALREFETLEIRNK